MDDVGQTLLNWASAFGTQEMVKTGRSSLSSFIPPSSWFLNGLRYFALHPDRNFGTDSFLVSLRQRDLIDPVAFCPSRWSFSVKEVQMLTGVRGHPRCTTLPVLDVHKLPR